MVIKCENIINYMNEIAPEYLGVSWDNIGLLVGNNKSIIKKVLIALDATDSVIDEAIENKIDLIITHHPLMINHIKRVTNETLNGKLYKLIQNNIGLYSAHTNFDSATNGINDILVKLFGIKDVKVLDVTYTSNENGENKDYGLGRIGVLEEETTLLEYAKLVKEKLGLSTINVVGDLNRKIKKVALCSGNGSSFFEKAAQLKADVYISGDVKYHDALKALEMSMCWIDGTHYATENIAMPILKQYLEDKAKSENWEVEFINSKINGQPFKTV